METKYLAIGELEELIGNASGSSSSDEMLWFCTILEILQVADASKKGRNRLESSQFLDDWKAVRDRIHYLEALDRDCLIKALFEHEEAHWGRAFWPAAIEQGTSPERRSKRLILRPTNNHWWEDDFYDEMETRY